METYRWGILAPGRIARKFALGLKELPRAEIHAVASRNLARANTFADEFGIPKRYDNYESLATDPDIDIIYVANPHPFHQKSVLLCLDQKKAVLCEKPLGTNLEEVQTMVNKARETQIFLMEAMWMRFLPTMIQVRKWLADGLIGEVRFLMADFGFYGEFDPLNRKFNPDLAGGALLDIGIYPISLAYMIFGDKPIKIQSTAHLGSTGVDELSTYTFTYENGAVAQLSATYSTETPKVAHIMGTKGVIRLPLFWKAQEATVQLHGHPLKHYDFSYPATGLQYQAGCVMDCIGNGQTECHTMPLNETLQITRLMDDMRASWGMKYPWES